MEKKDKASKEFDQLPVTSANPEEKKVSEFEKFAEAVKKEFGFEVEPKKNRVKYNLLRAAKYLNDKYDFRYNEINTDSEFKLKADKEFIYLDDRDYRAIYLDLKIEGGITISDQDFKNLIYSERLSVKFNPFKEYLSSLPIWDNKTDYIKQFLEQVYLKDEKQRIYFMEGFTKWFTALIVSLVVDIPDRKYINQTCLVLVGGQGKYKSTFLKSIIPSHLQMKYFYGSAFIAHNKDHEKFLAYKILIDLDEMGSYNKTDIESMKSKITQDQVVVRLPYAKADIHLKRRASFCGSINNNEFLRDDTGSRRWFVIEIDRVALTDFPIDMMFAQGLALYKSKFKYWFDSDDINKLEVQNERFKLKGFEEEMILRYFRVPDPEDFEKNRIDYMTSTDIANYIADKSNKINVNNTVIKNVGSALKRLGYQRKSRRFNGQVLPMYAVYQVVEPKNVAVDEVDTGNEELF